VHHGYAIKSVEEQLLSNMTEDNAYFRDRHRFITIAAVNKKTSDGSTSRIDRIQTQLITCI